MQPNLNPYLPANHQRIDDIDYSDEYDEPDDHDCNGSLVCKLCQRRQALSRPVK